MVAVFGNEARTGRPGAWQAAMTLRAPAAGGVRPAYQRRRHVDLEAKLAAFKSGSDSTAVDLSVAPGITVMRSLNASSFATLAGRQTPTTS